MNLAEERQRGLIPPGLQSWPLQLIEHLTNTTSVAPPPAGPAGCRPLYLSEFYNIWAPKRCCTRTKVATSLVLLCDSQVPAKERCFGPRYCFAKIFGDGLYRKLDFGLYPSFTIYGLQIGAARAPKLQPP